MTIRSYPDIQVKRPLWASTPAIQYSVPTLPISLSWQELKYLNGSFYTFGSFATTSSYFLYSTNGINWKTSLIPTSIQTKFMDYRNSLYVLGGSSSTIVTSSDTINWTVRNLPVNTTAAQDMSYGNGAFVIVCGAPLAAGNSYIFRSTDGITWTQHNSPSNQYWTEIEYGNSIFVIAASTSSNLATSTDGITWTQTLGGYPAATNGASALGFGNGLFIINSSSGSNLGTSTDGVNWTSRNTPLSSFAGIFKQLYLNNNYYALPQISSLYAYSTDAITWTQGQFVHPNNNFNGWSNMIYANGLYFLGTGSTTFNNGIILSTNGINWSTNRNDGKYLEGTITPYLLPEARSILDINKEYIAYSSVNNALNVGIYKYGDAYVSIVPITTDGVVFKPKYSNVRILPPIRIASWTARANNQNGLWNVVTYGNGSFVAMIGYGTTSNVGSSSTDGITWTLRTLGATSAWTGCVWGNNLFVAVSGNTNTSYATTSTDGITWPLRTLPASVAWSSITYGNGSFVAVSNNSTAASTTDGITWALRTISANISWADVEYGNGIFVAIPVAASVSNASYSTDGITWTATVLGQNGPTGGYRSVAYGSGSFVAISGGSVASSIASSSSNGISWQIRTMPASATWISIAYGAGQFMAISGLITSSSIAAYSTDGITWTQLNHPAASLWKANTYGNGSFISIAGGSGGGATSYVATSQSIYPPNENVSFGLYEAP